MQWWYGHNAVAFFLTTPFLGLMYYFIPKAANRPVFSYRLSIIHFWALVFLYIWAGPHHLLYTALPDWAQSLGMVFSIMLIAPSWGGMVNGLLTLRGAWDRVREDPVLKFMVVGVTAYGMSTFEGPMMSLKSVNALTHYTDYTIGHVHLGALAWNGGIGFAVLYYVVPRIYGTKLYSTRLANVHFWFATLGILFYVDSALHRRHHAEPDVAGVRAGRRAPLPELPRDRRAHHPDVLAARGWRHAVHASGRWWRPTTSTRRRRQARSWPNERTSAPALVPEPAVGPRRVASELESRPVKFAVLTVVAVLIGGIVEFVPTALVRVEHSDDCGRQAVHAARGRGTRPLHPRRLRRLSLADDAADPRRDRALRRVLEGGRVRLRPSVPLGIEAHRARPAPRRRQVSRLVALPAHARAALDLAGLDHAGLHVAV